MADIKLAFLLQRPPYKSENPKLALTHAISYQTVEILLEDGETVTPTMCVVGEGVLGCVKDQMAMELYGMTSTEMHFKSCLLVDLDVLVCKEDLDHYGISEGMLPTAEDMGADKTIQVVPYAEIQKVIENAKHVLFF